MAEEMIKSLRSASFGKNGYRLQDFFTAETIQLIAEHLIAEGWHKDDTRES